MLPVISVENLSTHHPIGPRERYKAFRDVITDALTSPFRCLREHSQFAIRNRSCQRPPLRRTLNVKRWHVEGCREQ